MVEGDRASLLGGWVSPSLGAATVADSLVAPLVITGALESVVRRLGGEKGGTTTLVTRGSTEARSLVMSVGASGVALDLSVGDSG